MKKLMMVVAALSAIAASAEITITGVTARQRWPWNSLVDVDFAINGAAVGEAFAIDITAECAGGEKKLAACSYFTEPIAGPGTNRVVWDMGKDFPNFRAEDLRVTVTATPFSGSTPVYMVIDLSGGKDATTYPVRYTTTPPAHVQGGIDEPCQTTEMWLRRVPAAGRTFSSGWQVPADNNSAWWVKLTKDFYIGVFQVTQQQWFLMTGTWPSSFSNATYRASRPLDSYKPSLLFGSGGCTWADDNQTISGNCLLQTLRNRTGLSTLNLPTEAQFQFAACGNTITTPDSSLGSAVNYYKGYTQSEVCRHSGNQDKNYESGNCSTNSGTACVGSYKPNDYDLYDMIGNVAQEVLGYYGTGEQLSGYYGGLGAKNTSTPVVDPQGVPSAKALEFKAEAGWNSLRNTSRGGDGFYQTGGYNTLWCRNGSYPSYVDNYSLHSRGFRFAVTCE